MSGETLHLVNKNLEVLGRIRVEREKGNLRMGTFEPKDFPEEIRRLCDEYQELAENQILSALDAIEAELEAMGFQVTLVGSETYTPIADLQITSDNRISYRISDK